jgi:hypothetical protein
LWEDIAKENLPDCFIDLFDEPEICFNLIQEIFLICSEYIIEHINKKTIDILKYFEIPNDKHNLNQIEKYLKPIFQECYTYIFESSTDAEIFLQKVLEKYKLYIQEHFIEFDRIDEIYDVFKTKYFKDLIAIIKKILLFINFHDPKLNLKLDKHSNRKMEIKNLKSSDCICVDGYIKDNKNCIIYLSPPTLKNGYAYQGLKPIVLVYNKELPMQLPETTIVEKEQMKPINTNQSIDINMDEIKKEMKNNNVDIIVSNCQVKAEEIEQNEYMQPQSQGININKDRQNLVNLQKGQESPISSIIENKDSIHSISKEFQSKSLNISPHRELAFKTLNSNNNLRYNKHI